MHIKNKARAAGFAVRVVLATVTGQPPALAQMPEQPVRIASGAEAGVRTETLNLQRRDGSVLTLRVAYVDAFDRQVKQNALPGKDIADNLGLHD